MKKNLPANAGDVGSIPGPRRSPGKEMTTHSSILAWRTPRIAEPGGLQSMGSQRIKHDLATEHAHTVYFKSRYSEINVKLLRLQI